MHGLALITLSSLVALPCVGAELAARPLPASELAGLRGGVALPNGLDVAIGIDIQTLVDGELALHSVLSTQNGSPGGVRVLVDGHDPEPMLRGNAVDLQQVNEVPTLILDRRGAGTSLQITRNPDTPDTVNVVTVARELWPKYPGQTELNVTPNGDAVDTDLGKVTVTQTPNGTLVTLSSDSLVIRQMLGRDTGVAISNTASDRAIDTISAIDVDLKGLQPLITQGLFALDSLAAEAALRR